MDLQLSGKRALITGSSSGIGAAIALTLADEGCAIVVHGRNAERAQEVAEACKAKGVRAEVVLGAITVDAEADAIAELALAAFGGIDILVNSAGGTVRGDNPSWLDVSSQEWLLSFSLNVISVIRLAKRLTPGMIERGWGRIINLSSMAGTQVTGRLFDYGAAKAALDHLTCNMSRALAGRGVTVNAIVPGAVLTPQTERWINTLGEQNGWPQDFAERERIYTQDFGQQPVARLGRPDEIAAAVALLASPRSDYTTGASLRIDGGNTRAR